MSQAGPEEREAYRLAFDENPSQCVAARDLSIQVLTRNPSSIPARLVLALVEYEGERNFGRALFLVRKLRHEMQARGRSAPKDEAAHEWYLRILDIEYRIVLDMGKHAEAHRVAELIEQVYEPVPWRHIWPLVCANRIDEARQWLSRAEASEQMRSTRDQFPPHA